MLGTVEGQRAVAQQTFQTDGRVMVALGVLWFGSFFIHKFFCPSGEPLFCKGMRSVK